MYIPEHSSKAGQTWLQSLEAHPVNFEELYRSKPRTVRATLTNAPCTASCWHAEGDVCACSCGGKNHGIGHNPSEA